jgi:hypothetical protein
MNKYLSDEFKNVFLLNIRIVVWAMRHLLSMVIINILMCLILKKFFKILSEIISEEMLRDVTPVRARLLLAGYLLGLLFET